MENFDSLSTWFSYQHLWLGLTLTNSVFTEQQKSVDIPALPLLLPCLAFWAVFFYVLPRQAVDWIDSMEE